MSLTELAERANHRNNRAAELAEAGDAAGALPLLVEAAGLYRQLAAQDPGARLPLVQCLGSLASLQSALEKLDPALETAAEARREHAALPDPAMDVAAELAIVLANLSNHLAEQGRSREALELADAALRMHAPPFFADPRTHAPWMGSLARHYLQSCQALGQEPDHALLKEIDRVFRGR